MTFIEPVGPSPLLARVTAAHKRPRAARVLARSRTFDIPAGAKVSLPVVLSSRASASLKRTHALRGRLILRLTINGTTGTKVRSLRLHYTPPKKHRHR